MVALFFLVNAVILLGMSGGEAGDSQTHANASEK